MIRIAPRSGLEEDALVPYTKWRWQTSTPPQLPTANHASTDGLCQVAISPDCYPRTLSGAKYRTYDFQAFCLPLSRPKQASVVSSIMMSTYIRALDAVSDGLGPPRSCLYEQVLSLVSQNSRRNPLSRPFVCNPRSALPVTHMRDRITCCSSNQMTQGQVSPSWSGAAAFSEVMPYINLALRLWVVIGPAPSTSAYALSSAILSKPFSPSQRP
jgi:hypothetical protein